ncbi:unnamed protein product [Brassica oleracea]
MFLQTLRKVSSTSQYRAAHLSSRRSDFNNLGGPDHDLSHHNSLDHNSSHQHSLVHNSPNQHANDHQSCDQNSPHRRSPNHCSPNHHSPDTNSPQNRSPNHCSPNDHSPTNQLPHLNSLAHDSLNTKSPNHRTESPSSPDHNSTEHTISLGHPSPNYHSSKHVSPANDSGLPSSPKITLSDHVFNTPISPTYRPPPHAALSPQVSHSQQFAPIATLPQFDATPLNQPTSQSSPAHSLTLTEPDTAPPVYDSSALPYTPLPLFTPTPTDTTTPTS